MLPASTSRLEFRTWSETDASLAIALWKHSDLGAADEIASRARLQREIRSEAETGVQFWPLLIDGELVGCAGLRRYEDDLLELGAEILPHRRRQGIATEAAKAIIMLAFEHLRAPKLIAGHEVENEAAQRLLEGLGFAFTHEGREPTSGRPRLVYALERS